MNIDDAYINQGRQNDGFTQIAMLTPCFKTYCATMFDKKNLCEHHVLNINTHPEDFQ